MNLLPLSVHPSICLSSVPHSLLCARNQTQDIAYPRTVFCNWMIVLTHLFKKKKIYKTSGPLWSLCVALAVQELSVDQTGQTHEDLDACLSFKG